MRREPARLLFALTTACVLGGVTIDLINAGTRPSLYHGHFHAGWERSVNVLAFFTIQSNLLVAASCGLLAARPERSGGGFAVLRLAGLVAITVTGLVYHTVLAGLLDLHSWARISNLLTHTVVPVLAVTGWLLAGPRNLTGRRTFWAAAAFPVLWLSFTLARGAIIGWYPYAFIDVSRLGYGEVAFNCVWVTVLWLGLAAGAGSIDRRLRRPSAPSPSPA